MSNFFLTDKAVQLISTGVAAGTTDADFTMVDLTSGGYFDSVTCVVVLGTVVDGATLSLEAYTCSNSGGSNPDLIDDVVGMEGYTASVTAATSSNKLLVLSIVKPKTPFIQFRLNRGAQNATVSCALAFKTGPDILPVTQTSVVLSSALGAQL